MHCVRVADHFATCLFHDTGRTDRARRRVIMAKSFPSTSRDRPALVGAVVLLFLALCFALSPLLNATPSARAKAVAGKPLFAGVNLATGGVAPERIPGVYGHDYRYPDAQTAAPFVAMGMNAFWLRVL